MNNAKDKDTQATKVIKKNRATRRAEAKKARSKRKPRTYEAMMNIQVEDRKRRDALKARAERSIKHREMRNEFRKQIGKKECVNWRRVILLSRVYTLKDNERIPVAIENVQYRIINL